MGTITGTKSTPVQDPKKCFTHFKYCAFFIFLGAEKYCIYIKGKFLFPFLILSHNLFRHSQFPQLFTCIDKYSYQILDRSPCICQRIRDRITSTDICCVKFTRQEKYLIQNIIGGWQDLWIKIKTSLIFWSSSQSQIVFFHRIQEIDFIINVFWLRLFFPYLKVRIVGSVWNDCFL